MHEPNLFADHSISPDEVIVLSQELCNQADCLRERLTTSMDNDDLSSAVDVAERSVGNDCIAALLAMVQSVQRDASNDFKPMIEKDDRISLALSEMADVALLTLSSLYIVAEAFIMSHGWVPIDLSSNVQGGIVYEHSSSKEISEDPEVKGMSWQMKLMLSIPILIEPGCLDGQVVWAANVVYYQHSDIDEPYNKMFYLEDDSSNRNCISVIDVIKSDDDGNSSMMRGTYRGCWRGLYAEAVGEMDMSKSLGERLESWVETTLAGLSVKGRVLVIGLGNGQLVSFLQKHIEDIQLHIVDTSVTFVDISFKYFNLNSSLRDRISILDPLEFVKNECTHDCTYDTIIVNLCSSDDEFPSILINEQFFDGLISMLSHHPLATLLVNSGLSMTLIAEFVGNSCKNMCGHRHGSMLILREYLLRDHSDSENEGIIIAARRTEWSLTVADWNREHIGAHVQTSGAMSIADAQKTSVIRLEKFLSESDIELIHSIAKHELERTKALCLTKGLSNGNALARHSESWRVLYLQHNDVFRRKLPELRQRILDKIREVDKNNWSLFDNVEYVNIRVVEYHQMDEFGELADPKHYDLNSLLTMDIMLSNECDFEGGQFQTEEADGTLKQYKFEKGDALIFVSHKPHCVSQVQSGRRNVLVLEFWYGPERQCPHRCEKFGTEICTLDPFQHVSSSDQSMSKQDQKLSLPFRLGSVSSCKEHSYDILELLWEPSTTSEPTSNALPVVSEEAEASLEQAWDLFD